LGNEDQEEAFSSFVKIENAEIKRYALKSDLFLRHAL